MENWLALPVLDFCVTLLAQLQAAFYQEILILASVWLMTVTAAAFPNGFMEVLTAESLADVTMTRDTEYRWSLEQKTGTAAGVWVVATRAIGLLRRRMGNRRGNLRGHVVVASEAHFLLVDPGWGLAV